MKVIAAHAFSSIILLLAISAGALFFRLGSLPLLGPDEPRYARVAEEMYEQGRWTTPTLEGKPWLEKPPLYYWIAIPFLSLMGENEWAVRLGPALCGVLTALGLYWLGSTLRTRRTGLIAASILLTSIGFIGFGRSASTDMPFTCCFTLAMAILAAALKQKTSRVKAICAYAFLGLAVLGKGPVAIILAAGICACFWLLDERALIFQRWHILKGSVVTAAISLPWFWMAFQQNGYSFISTFFLNHNIARYVTGIHHHSQPFYFFIPVLIALFFPWSGWMILTFKSSMAELRRWREWDPAIVFLYCWGVFPILFFSFSDSKLAGYILPSLPPIALILGVRLSDLIYGEKEKSNLSKLGLYLSTGLSLVFAAGSPIFFQTEYGDLKTGLIIGGAILAASISGLVLNLLFKKNRIIEAFIAQGLLAVIIVVQFASPALGTYHSTRDIAVKALSIQKAGEPIVTYGFFHHTLNYYTRYRIAGDIYDPDAMSRFAREHSSSLIVTTVDGPQTLLSIPGFSFELLGKQGDLLLFRISKMN